MSPRLVRNFDTGAAADLWRHTLSRIPCTFGRLVYLSSLRNSNTGRYEHHGLASIFGEEEAHRTLFECHLIAFRELLEYPLEHQKTDLDFYLSTLTLDKPTLVRAWLRLSTHRNFIPDSVSPAERQLYLVDVEAMLNLLRIEYGLSVEDTES